MSSETVGGLLLGAILIIIGIALIRFLGSVGCSAVCFIVGVAFIVIAFAMNSPDKDFVSGLVTGIVMVFLGVGIRIVSRAFLDQRFRWVWITNMLGVILIVAGICAPFFAALIL